MIKENLVLDASGKAGAPGSNGADGIRSGENGRSGRAGSAGKAGGQLAVSARMTANGLELPGMRPVALHEMDRILLLARGGAGGRGGNGGRGGDGSRGSSGSDAGRYSDATPGGRGGPGGDGGQAGRGGDSGPGGRVELKLAREDLDLALLFDWDVSAGTPGPPGLPGDGGSGGPGGRGGSSYSWSESENYTDSQGNTQTRSVSRYRSGASDGPSGSPGSSGSTAPFGEGAADGTFVLLIDEKKHPDRYRLSLLDYQVQPGGGEGLFEFGELDNRVTGLRLANRGGAPSPPQHVAMFLAENPGLVPQARRLEVPEIDQGKHQALGSLVFDLEEASDQELPSLHQRLRKRVRIDPVTHFVRLKRRACEADLAREIEVTYPVELITVPSPTSLLPGQFVVQCWRIKNHSNAAFPPPGRELTLELDHGDLVVLDDQGKPPAKGFSIEPIAPGGELEFRLYIAFAAEAPPYSRAELWVGLRLTPRGGGEAREIQRNPVTFTAAQAHRGVAAEVLLVTHSGNSQTEVEGWIELFDRLGLQWDVWDATWHGDIPLNQLAPRIQGKLVVLLNATFATPDRQQIATTELLPMSTFREAVSKFGISFYVMGAPSQLHLNLLPFPEQVREFDSPAKFLASLQARRGPNPEVPETMESHLDRVFIRRFHIVKEPKPIHLEAEARKLALKLSRDFPERRFAVSMHFEACQDKGPLRTRSYGHLDIRQLPDADARAVVIREVYTKTAQRPAFIHSAENLLGLFSAMDFDDKLALARKLEEQQSFAIEALADAWLLDLGEEQMALRRSGVHTGKRRIRRILHRTGDLCSHDFRQGKVNLEVDSPLGQLLTRIAAGLLFLSKSRLHWSDHRLSLLGGTNEVEISEVVNHLVDQLLDLNFGRDRWIGRQPEARLRVEKLIAERSAELTAEAEQIHQLSQGAVSSKDSALEALVRWDLRDYLECDSKLPSGVYDDENMRVLREREWSARKRHGELLEIFAQARKAGQLPEGWTAANS